MKHSEMISLSTSYVTKLLRSRFGKGPQSVKIVISARCIVFQLRHFISPVEDFLLVHDEEETFRYTRELIMNAVLQDLQQFLQQQIGLQVVNMYYDWGVHNASGVIVGMLEMDADDQVPDYEGKQTFERKLSDVLEEMQKRPQQLDSWWVDPSILCIYRCGITKLIELELIELGHQDLLKKAKRRLEKRVIAQTLNTQKLLGKSPYELYLDWDFDRDDGIILYTFD
ncbi:Na-translocating system protein MpsC family protein [Paenibacillus sp. SGZ-1009]|uniref:Na-translocating system protein MpsC family protein n=1 Tax=Paenibacillus campi TaxID=3106031 RepID=UPI002AFFA6D1|nr:Na-translocating system protein MpsC family protein [Paenibacillus sp. SGZ-1009]